MLIEAVLVVVERGAGGATWTDSCLVLAVAVVVVDEREERVDDGVE